MPEINGTPGNDSNLAGTNDNDVINGGAGNDTLRGLGGDDQLNGDEDSDLLTGGTGDDIVDGGDGQDRAGYYNINGTATGVTVSLWLQGDYQDTVGQGWDYLRNIEHLSGTPYADTLTGDNGNNWLWGSTSRSGGVAISTANNDTLNGEGGNDLLVVGTGDHMLNGGDDIDTVRYTENEGVDTPINVSLGIIGPQNTGAGTWTLTGIENLSGGNNNDILSGNFQANTIAGDLGNDTINGGGGADLLLGDGYIRTDANGVITTFNEGLAGQGGNDNLNGGSGNDTLYGGAGQDNLSGSTGNDSLFGGAGDDFLSGSLDDDYIDGGNGFDRASYGSVNAALGGVTVSLATPGTPQNVGAGLGIDTLVNVEAVSGTSFADNLTGDANDNWLWGSVSQIVGVVSSSTNDDTIDGGGGNDLIQVGTGNHSLIGGDDIDTLQFSEGDNGFNITLSLMEQGSLQNTGQGNWMFTGFENLSGATGDDVLDGDDGANVLAGDLGSDELYGAGGNDTLYGDGSIRADTRPTGGSGPITTFPDAAFLYVGGFGGDDYMEGGGGNDSIYGGGGADVAFGGDGADTIHGGDGNDTLIGGSIINSAPQPLDEVDTIYGEAGNDVIRGGGGDDYLDGGEGDDNLRGDLGDDTLIGGTGRDFVSYRFDDAGVTGSVYFDAEIFAATASFTQDDGRGGIDSLSDVESLGITGSAFDDVLIGSYFTTSTATQVANVISGNGGNDEIYGGDDWDQLDGGAGNDYIEGRGGGDGITGGADNDRLIGGGGNDFLDGGADVDYITGGEGDDVIVGGSGGDRIGYYHVNAALGGVAVSLATLSAQSVGGGQGSDTISEIEHVSGTPFADVLTGNDDHNFLWGSAAFITGVGLSGSNNDTIDGGLGDDLLQVGIGTQSLTGGGGIDTVRFTENGAPENNLILSLAIAGAQLTGNGTWTLSGIENISGGIGNDQLTGDDQVNVMAGDGGNDQLSGGIGNDTLYGDGAIVHNGSTGTIVTNADVGANGNDLLEGGIGDDHLYGGGGSDTASYANASGGVIVDLWAGTATGGDGNDTLNSIENAIGSASGDQFWGNDLDNIFAGMGGNDQLRGDLGNDGLDGGAGNDLIIGGAGNDIIFGGSGNDRIGYYHTNAAAGGVTVSLATLTAQNVGGGQGADTISGVENVSGTPFADVLTGNNDNNWLWGSASTIGANNVSTTNNDILDAGGGNDLLTVGIGNHILIGGADIDTVSFSENNGAEPGISITLGSEGRVQNTGQGRWTLTGIENLSGAAGIDKLTGNDFNNVLAGNGGDDSLTGNGGHDILLGDGFIYVPNDTQAITTVFDVAVGGGNDILNGGRGDDRLYGGRGNDTMTGGANSDWFVIQAGSGNDIITDFTFGADRIAFDYPGAPDDFSDLTFTKSGGNVLITWDTGDSILVQGARVTQFTAASFQFGAPPPIAAAMVMQEAAKLVAASGFHTGSNQLDLDASLALRAADEMIW